MPPGSFIRNYCFLLILIPALLSCADTSPTVSPIKSSPAIPTPTILQIPTSTPTPIPTPTPLPTFVVKNTHVAPMPNESSSTPENGLDSQAPNLDYRNSTFGFSIKHPSDWIPSETVNPLNEPIFYAEGPFGIRRLFVFLKYVDDVLDIDSGAMMSQQGYRTALGDLDINAEETLTVGNRTPAALYAFDVEGEVPRRTKILVAVRGNQLWEVVLQTARADFDLQSESLDQILSSFALEEPSPHGLDRNETLTLFDQFGPTTLDPHLSEDISSHRYISQIFSGLVRLDKDLVLIPDLAESWEITGNGTVFLFKIRDSITFHDGRPVSANDFKWSFERAVAPGTRSRTASTYLGDIVGFNDRSTGNSDDMPGIRIIAPNILRIEIDSPKSYFLSKLSYPTAYVLDQYNVDPEGTAWFLNPNGTGPFKLKAWDIGTVLVLKGFTDYYSGSPALDNVVFRLYGGYPLRMYESGEIDVAQLDLSGTTEVRKPTNPFNKELQVSPELSIRFVGFNTSIAPFDNPKVRRAFLLAIDHDELINTMNLFTSQPFGNTIAKAKGLLPPGLPGHNLSIPPLVFNLEASLSLLEEAHYNTESAPPLIFNTVGASPLPAAIAKMWRDHLGVRIDIVSLPSYSMLKTSSGHLYDFGWVADYPNPQNFLEILFRSHQEFNYSVYQNSTFDALVNNASLEPDEEKRLLLYQQAEAQLLDDAVVVPLWHGINHILVRPYVKSWFLDALGIPRLYDIHMSR